MNRSEIKYDETIEVGNRVEVSKDDKSIVGTVQRIAGDKGLTHEYICVGVEFDDKPTQIYYWYPWEVKKI